MSVKKIFAFIALAVSLQGCLVFNTVSYEIDLESENSGSVSMLVNDIRSDAMNTTELEEDKDQLFNFMLKSDDFIQQMKDVGRNITDRRLFISGGKLSGSVKYSFDDISSVENFVFQDDFYFVTLEPSDSIITTNGEVISSAEYKRIMWDKSVKTMKFEIYSTDVSKGSLVELTKYLEE